MCIRDRKNAVMALRFKHLKISGYGFFLMHQYTRIGFVIKVIASMDPTKRTRSFPYSVKIFNPLVEIVRNTRPRIPNGARLIIHVTSVETAPEISLSMFFVVSAALRNASPSSTAQNKICLLYTSRCV